MALTELEKIQLITELLTRIGVNSVIKIDSLPTISTGVSDDYIVVQHNGVVYKSKISDLPPYVSSYTDAQARAAMGTKDDSNPYHHDRYTDVEALAATIDDSGSTTLGWSASKIQNELATLTTNGAKITDVDDDTYIDVESTADIDIINIVSAKTGTDNLINIKRGDGSTMYSFTADGKIVGTSGLGLYYNDGATDGATDYAVELTTYNSTLMWTMSNIRSSDTLYTNSIAPQKTVVSGSSSITNGNIIIIDNLISDQIIELPYPSYGKRFELDIKDVSFDTTVLAFSSSTINIGNVEVVGLGRNITRYHLSHSPDLSSVLTTDYIKVEDCTNIDNNGTFEINAVNNVSKYIDIVNAAGVDEDPSVSGTIRLSVLRLPNPLTILTLNVYYMLTAYPNYDNYRVIKLD